jgi:hypothetical protein
MSPAVLTSPEAGVAAALPWPGSGVAALEAGGAVVEAVLCDATLPPHAVTPRLTAAIARLAPRSRLGIGSFLIPMIVVTGADGAEAR